MSNRGSNDFTEETKQALAKRVAFLCSNPSCKNSTMRPSEVDNKKSIFTGIAAHITAASNGGPRFDPTLSQEERSSIENGIFLCSTCASMIDKNDGIDFTVEKLKEWKKNHEEYVLENYNKSSDSKITIIDGEHRAVGRGNVTGLKISGPTLLKPGTKVIAEGEGTVIGTQVG